MLKTFVLGMLTLAALTGCGTTAQVAPLTTETRAEGPARRVMSTDGAALWGINYSQYYEQVSTRNKWTGARGSFQGYRANANFAGKGALITLTHDRYVFQVPEGQVLVINQIEGTGTIFINGYGVQAYTAPLAVQYVFGPGELVGIRFAPRRAGSDGTHNYYYQRSVLYYTPLHISGYLADPALFSGTGGKLAK